jgi:hypothetical protein
VRLLEEAHDLEATRANLNSLEVTEDKVNKEEDSGKFSSLNASVGREIGGTGSLCYGCFIQDPEPKIFSARILRRYRYVVREEQNQTDLFLSRCLRFSGEGHYCSPSAYTVHYTVR